MKRLILSSILALCFLSAPAFSMVCFKRAEFLTGTKETETYPVVRFMAQNAKGAPLMVEIFANAKGETLLVNTLSNGTSCVLTTGVGLTFLKEIPGNDT